VPPVAAAMNSATSMALPAPISVTPPRRGSSSHASLVTITASTIQAIAIESRVR